MEATLLGGFYCLAARLRASITARVATIGDYISTFDTHAL